MKVKYILILIPVIFIIVFLVIYFWPSQPCSTFPVADMKSNPSIPSYLEHVWPAPNAVITQKCYQEQLRKLNTNMNTYSGFGFYLSTLKIEDLSKPYQVDQEIIDRISVYLDGKGLPISQRVIETYPLANVWIENPGSPEEKKYTLNEAGSYKITYTPIPDIGIHKVKVKIINNKGKTFEYLWEFTIK